MRDQWPSVDKGGALHCLTSGIYIVAAVTLRSSFRVKLMFILSLATGTHLPYTGISNEIRTHNITGADLRGNSVRYAT